MAWEVATFIGKWFKAGLGQGFRIGLNVTPQPGPRNSHPVPRNSISFS